MSDNENIVAIDIEEKGLKAKDGVFRYYSSNEFEQLIDCLRIDTNYLTKKRFISDLVKGTSFYVKDKNLEKHNDQLKLFHANKSQLEKMDSFLMNKISKSMINTTNKFKVEDYTDMQNLIDDMHIVNSETTDAKDLKHIEFTENSEFGLTHLSPQFTDCYIKILESALYIFDFHVATPIHTNFTDDHPYILDLMKRIKELPEEQEEQEDDLNYKSKGIKKRQIGVMDKPFFDEQCRAYKEVVVNLTREKQYKNKEVVSVLLNTINELDKVNVNKKTAIKCISKLQLIMIDINKSTLAKKTNTDYLIHLLKNIVMSGYHFDDESRAIIVKVKADMKRLNTAITDYNSYSISKGATLEDRCKKIIKVRLILRQIAINNYNLVKRKL